MTLFILVLIAIAWGFAFWKWPERVFGLLPLILPLYVIRTNIGPLPTTGLELIIIATVIVWLAEKGILLRSSMTQSYGGQAGHGTWDMGLKRIWSDTRSSLLGTVVRERRALASRFSLPVLLWLLAGFISIFVSPNHISAIGLYRAYFIEPILLFIIGLDLARGDRRSEIGDWNEENRKQKIVNRIWMKFKNILNKTFKTKSDIQPSSPLAPRPSPLASSFALILILLGLYSIIQIFTGWGIPDPWNFVPGRRAVGFFPFPNALALFVTPIAAFLFADLIRGWNQKKEDREWLVSPWLSIPAYLLALISIILAASDGGLIALGVATFAVLVLNKKTRLFGIGLAVAGVILIGSITPLRERVTTVLMFREWSSKVRIVMWQETLMMLKDHKIMGAGLGGYPFVIRVYHRSGNWMEVFQYPHNVILNIWSETGLLGLFAFGWILIRWAWGMGHGAWGTSFANDSAAGRGTWKKDSRRRRTPDGDGRLTADGRTAVRPYVIAIPIILAILVHGLVDVPYFKNDLAIIFWLLILVTMTDRRTASDRRTET